MRNNVVFLWMIFLIACNDRDSIVVQIGLDEGIIQMDSISVDFPLQQLHFKYISDLNANYFFHLSSFKSTEIEIKIWKDNISKITSSFVDKNQSDTVYLFLKMVNENLQLSRKKKSLSIFLSAIDKSYLYQDGAFIEELPFSILYRINDSQILYYKYSGDRLVGYDLNLHQDIFTIELPEKYLSTVSTIIYSKFYDRYIFDIQTSSRRVNYQLVVIDIFGNYSAIELKDQIYLPKNNGIDKWIYYVKNIRIGVTEIWRLTADLSKNEKVFSINDTYISKFNIIKDWLIVFYIEKENLNKNSSFLFYNLKTDEVERYEQVELINVRDFLYLNSDEILISGEDLNKSKGTYFYNMTTKEIRLIKEGEFRIISN